MSELGEPKKPFSETFSAATAMDAAYLAASGDAAPQPTQVAIKPLEWSEFRSDDNVLFMQASGLGVRYEVFHKASYAATAGVQVARYLRSDPTDDDEIVEVIGYGRDLAGAYAIAQADYEARIRSALAQPSAPEGWVMVPVKPTREMLDIINTMRGPAYIYRAMLAARPLPPAPTAEEV